MNNVNWEELWKTKKQSLQPKHKQALELINILSTKEEISSLCDFGCGQGTLLCEIKEMYSDLEVCGADNNEFSKQALDKLGISYVDFDLLKDENKKEFSVAVLTDVLEHFYNPSEVLKNLSNIKNIIIVVPNFSFITERKSVLSGEVPFQMKPQRGGHFFWFNENTLNELINNSEYEIIEILNTYPKKLNYFPYLKKFNNLFATSFGMLLRKK